MNYLKNVTTLQLDNQKCTGCGRCIDVCPLRVLTINNKKAVIGDRDKCIECGACQRNCAFNAITVSSGVGCAQAFFNSLFNGGKVTCGCDSENNEPSKGCC